MRAYHCQAMRKVIQDIARARGEDWREMGWHVRLEAPGFEVLCIERIWPDQVSVAHYYEQNGDLVQDPDIVFYDQAGEGGAQDGIFTPIYYQDARMFNEAMGFVDGKPATVNLAMSRSIGTFANQWAKNIRMQGFVKAAKGG